MSEFFKVDTCKGCNSTFSSSELKKYKGDLYCKSCLKKIKPAITRKSTSRKAKEPKAGGAGITSADLVPLVESVVKNVSSGLASTITTVLSKPIKVELTPLKVELIGTEAASVPSSTVPIPSTLDSMQDPEIPDPPLAILRIMGKKKKKWRPREIQFELKMLYPTMALREDDIKRILDQLAAKGDNIPADMRVVPLSTRFIRRDHFKMMDEIEFVDILVISILAECDFGLPATLVHEAIKMTRLVDLSMPTLLNHLRMLRSPGWGLLKKAEPSKRANYLVTEQGIQFRTSLRKKIAALDEQPSGFLENLHRLGMIDELDEITTRVIVVLKQFKDMIENMGSLKINNLLLMFEADQLNDEMRLEFKRELAVLRHVYG